MPRNVIRFLKLFLIFIYLTLPVTLAFDDMFVVDRNEWLFSIIILFLLIITIQVRNQIVLTFLSLILSVPICINAAQAASYVLQGSSFNYQFFAHLDLSSLKLAWIAERPRLLSAILYIILAPLIVFIALKTDFRGKKQLFSKYYKQGVFSCIMLSLYATYNAPLALLFHFYTSSKVSSERILTTIETFSKFDDKVTAGNNKNLVLIYLEGLEQNYLDEDLFPKLLPRLQELRKSAVSFTNIKQYPGTSWTIAGLVSSQCAVPLLSNQGGNSVLKKADNPFSKVNCLAEHLKVIGYNTLFVGGASLDFAGKGRFLADNGFDQVLGYDELPSTLSHSWGLYDQKLFSHVERLFGALAAQDRPFLLSTLTLDTHHPTGHPSPNCPKFGTGDSSMLNAVHCTDKLIGEFVSNVRMSSVGENTVIVLVSDHLAMPKGVVDRLSVKDRRLLFMIIDPSSELAGEYDFEASHFDIAPTILSFLGINNVEFAFGHSLMRNEQGKVVQNGLTQTDFDAFRIEHLVNRF